LLFYIEHRLLLTARIDNSAMSETIYTDGAYLAKTGGTWHLEDSTFKAQQITRMLRRHPEFRPGTVCEIGCGAGGILSELQKSLPSDVDFTGYEISPQAHTLSAEFTNPRCRFILGDAFADDKKYDLVLVMDVIEHVEDCFSFLRHAKCKGHLKVYHVPLDAHVSALLRGINGWDSVGHIHLFTIETALKAVEYSGHRILDWVFTEGALAKTNKALRTRLANVARVSLGKLAPRLVARLMGGYSMLILAD
jgi:cyclopropane fatty-acyl-phospholipid synthase-like methyltransferase